jgi:hypothetical protein
MNATNPSHASLQAEQKAHEPSMEDILASIRRIIADDDALPLSRRASPAPAKPEPEPARAEPARPESARPEPARPDLSAAAPAPSPAPVAEPVAPLVFAARPEASPKPPPIPNLRDLTLRFDSHPASLSSQLKAEAAPPDLRPSLDDSRPVEGGGAEQQAAAASQPALQASQPAAPASVVRVVAPAPQPVAAPTVSFEPGAFNIPPKIPQIPPLSFRASVAAPVAPPPAPVTLALVEPSQAPAGAAAGPDERRIDAPAAAEPARPAPVGTVPWPNPPRAPVLPPARLDHVEPAMLSEHNGFKVGAAFEALAESALLRDPELVERLTRELLRPMIKTWLDDNLPNVVERLVRAEIERVARGPKG